MSPKARTKSRAQARATQAQSVKAATAKPKTKTTKTAKAGSAKGSAAKRRSPVAKPASAVGAPRAARSTVAAPRTLDDLMREALVMELDAAQRYAEFADAMETHNNLEVAALFRKMAGIEGKHAEQIMAEMGWTAMPAPRTAATSWEGFEAPETTPGDAVHYLMQPYHALELALANEQRALRFFARLARAATSAAVRKAARELQAEEREHVELVRAWMKRVPPPDADWANDPDPPVYTD
jgi:rubrerythrin